MPWKSLLLAVPLMVAFVIPGCSLPGNSGAHAGKTENKRIKLGWRDNSLALPVVIQGMPGCLMADTGSYDTYLNTRVAGAMGVSLRKTNVQIRGIAGSQSDIMEGKISGRVRGLDPGAFSSLAGNHRFRTMPDQSVPGMGLSLGNLGLEQLADANALIDCAAGTLTIAASGQGHPLPRGWRELRLVKHRFETGGFMWLVPVTIGSAEGLMIVDTLAGLSLVAEPFAKSIGMGLSPSTTSAYGVGGWTGSLKKGMTPDLAVGGVVNLGSIEVLSSSMKIFERSDKNSHGRKVPLVGLLGMDQLIRMKARFDCAAGTLQVPQ